MIRKNLAEYALIVPGLFILGTSFDPIDFGCYFIGLIIAWGLDLLLLQTINGGENQ